MGIQPLVSVVIPTFNRAYFLKEALNSVFSQTFKKFEVIVIDDGSQDITREIVHSFFEVRYYFLRKNRGVSFARNYGIRRAKGKYICFLDSDDRWLPKKLEYQFFWMEANTHCSLSYTDEIWIRNGKRVNAMNKHRKFAGDIFQYCLPLCIVSPSSVMIRSEFFEEVGLFDEDLPVCEDYDLWLRMALKTNFQLFKQKLIVKYGGHADQLSKKYWGMDRFRVYVLEKLLCSDLLKGEKRFQLLEILKQKCDILSKGFAKRQKSVEAEYYNNLIEKYELKNSINPYL